MDQKVPRDERRGVIVKVCSGGYYDKIEFQLKKGSQRWECLIKKKEFSSFEDLKSFYFLDDYLEAPIQYRDQTTSPLYDESVDEVSSSFFSFLEPPLEPLMKFPEEDLFFS